MTLARYIKQKKRNKFKTSGVEVNIKDPIPGDLNISNILSKIEARIPSHLRVNFRELYIGEFAYLTDKNLSAAYQNSSIYLTNQLDNEADAIDDIVHELAHSIEGDYHSLIYGDGEVKEEFLRKRKKVWEKLKLSEIDLDLSLFLNPEYVRQFDELLYLHIGYPRLSAITADIFYSPYACTSLSEYYANGFEAFFMKENTERLRVLSPKLYKKLIDLLEKDK